MKYFAVYTFLDPNMDNLSKKKYPDIPKSFTNPNVTLREISLH